MKSHFKLSVRELVEFVHRRGDRSSDTEILVPDRALKGLRAHQEIQRSRPRDYQSEVSLKYRYEDEALSLVLQGRADGLMAEGEGVRIEEIKTVTRRWDGRPRPLHWAQLRIYAAIYAQQHPAGRIGMVLSYYQLETGAMRCFSESSSNAEVQGFFESTLGSYLEWLHDHVSGSRLRDRSIQRSCFPFPRYRAGQETLMRAVRDAVREEAHLFVEAPTGMGKTVAVLQAAITQLRERRIRRVFYLTGKSEGQTAALKAVEDLKGAGLRMRVLQLVGRDRICVMDGGPCDRTLCPYRRGYYDRARAAMRTALARESVDAGVLQAVAREARVCPHALAMDLAPWVDLLIGDYNYAFDPQARLSRFFDDSNEPHILLLDEAHNLVDRAREMFSRSLNLDQTRAVSAEPRRDLAGFPPAVSRCFRNLRNRIAAWIEGGHSRHPVQGELPGLGTDGRPGDRKGRVESGGDGIWVLADLPGFLVEGLRRIFEEIGRGFWAGGGDEMSEKMLQLYLEVGTFLRLAQDWSEAFRVVVSTGSVMAIRLLCLNPAERLAGVLRRSVAGVFFSATLSPIEYYRTVLGGRESDRLLQLASPFDQGCLGLIIHPAISTAYRHRRATLGALAAAVEVFVKQKTGNYLVYLPSFEYLQQVWDRFVERLDQKKSRADSNDSTRMKLLRQDPGMNGAERDAFLKAFAMGPDHIHVGFAVMGGQFGEAIDLIGDRLIGVIVVGPGLPQVGLERELMRRYFEGPRTSGYEYAYQIPGWNRVLQATGRLIRSEQDRGVVMLVDPRFSSLSYRRLFPRGWRPVLVRCPEEVRAFLSTFWKIGVMDCRGPG